MERIEFKYDQGADFGHSFSTNHIESSISDKDECGLVVDEVCEAFVQFMESVGFSVDQVLSYFEE